MLTKAEALFEIHSGRLFPDRLKQKSDKQYLALAAGMLAIYANGVGEIRSELDRKIDELFWGETCPPQRIKAFCKLLDDASEYEGKEGGKAADLRMRVFTLAAPRYPLVRSAINLLSSREESVKAEIATAIKRPWEEIESALFSDVYELQRMKKFDGYESPAALLTRYNEAQIQAALYSATELHIIARRDYRAIIMAAKRARLLHDVERLANDAFRFTFYGPVAPLRTTKRYGVDFSRIVPTLLACHDWELSATIRNGRHSRPLELSITSRDGYRSSSHGLPEYDSDVEKRFAEKWGTEPRDGWTLKRETEPRFSNQKAFFPDFTFVHEDGRRVLMEIVGYWTPEYLESKRKTMMQFRDEPLILAVGHQHADAFPDCGIPVITYKSTLKIEPILATLASLLKP